MHWDLKLSNILLNDNEAWIGDLGLAVKLLNEYEERKTYCGTPNYISPEIVSKQSYDLRSDIWSLGCILYVMLVGKAPFEDTTV